MGCRVDIFLKQAHARSSRCGRTAPCSAEHRGRVLSPQVAGCCITRWSTRHIARQFSAALAAWHLVNKSGAWRVAGRASSSTSAAQITAEAFGASQFGTRGGASPVVTRQQRLRRKVYSARMPWLGCRALMQVTSFRASRSGQTSIAAGSQNRTGHPEALNRGRHHAFGKVGHGKPRDITPDS